MSIITRTEWLNLPCAYRTQILANKPVSTWDNYLCVQKRLYHRFYREAKRRGECGVCIERNGQPAPYRILEDMAYMRYVVYA